MPSYRAFQRKISLEMAHQFQFPATRQLTHIELNHSEHIASAERSATMSTAIIIICATPDQQRTWTGYVRKRDSQVRPVNRLQSEAVFRSKGVRMSSYGGFTVEERLQKWKDILGIDGTEEGAKFEKIGREETLKNSKTRVINQDVLRTRADEPFFKSSMVKAVLKQTLIKFCSYHRIEYMQGLNEILAPILSLDVELVRSIEETGTTLASGSNDSADGADSYDIKHPFGVNLLIFERMMTKLSPTTFSTRGVDAIQVQLTTFHLLLMYHEPVLATILRKEGMTPDIFAMSWLITLFARRQPVQRALHIWDMLLQLDAPYLCVFLSVALIRSRRDRILNDCADVLPETLVSLKFESDEEIDIVFADALLLVQSTPANITTELMNLGFDNQIDERAREKGVKDLWHRPCVVSSAAEVARHLAQPAEGPANSNSEYHRPPPRYLVLDCRHTVEKQLLDAHYIEGSVSVPQAVQDEICSLARHKSGLLEHGEMELEMDLSNATDPADVERSFAKVVAQLSTRTAALLALLWAAFVMGTTEEVHFAIADDSTGPYLCPSYQKAPLDTSYPLPYHTASGASDDIPLRERTFSETTENLPQYLTNSHATLSNTNSISFASALIILGFPRVSIVQGEVIFKDSMSNENLLFSCTENNSFSSLPVMKTEQRSSGFTCLVHYLGTCSVNTGTINARYSHIQVPIDHFKEYQVAAFVHELRTSVIHSDNIDADYYAHIDEHSIETPPHASKGAASNHGTPLSIVAAVMSAASTSVPTAPHNADGPHQHRHVHEKHKHGHLSHTHKHASSKSTLSSSISSALSALTPSVTPRSAKTVKLQTRETRVPSFASEPLLPFPQFNTGVSGNNNGAINNGGPSQAGGTESISTSSTMMQAKLGCNLDNLYRLLLIMSAQKRQHITRLVVSSHFHSTVPLARSYSHSPAADEESDYARFLGTKPCGGDSNLSDSKLSTVSRTCNNHNLVYYEKLERLLTLRETLQELVNTQRLNDVLDKTSNKMATKMRLLRSAIEQTNKHTRRSIAGLQRKTVLRSTQRRLQADADAAKKRANGGDSTETDLADGDGGWQTVKDLSAFFRQQEDRHEGQDGQDGQRSESRSSSVLRDSLSADGTWDRGRLMSDDSIDVKLTASMSMSDLL